MRNVYVIATGKGGTGKTTTAFHLAHYLAERGTPPLVIGLDDMCGITELLKPVNDKGFTCSDVLMGRCTLSAAATGSQAIRGVGVVRESSALRETESHLTLNAAGVFAIASMLHKAKDWLRDRPVIIDTPGALGTLTKAAMLASARVILPISPSEIDIEATKQTLYAVDALVDTLRSGGVNVDEPNIAAVIITRLRRHDTGWLPEHERAVTAVLELFGKSGKLAIGMIPLADGADRFEKRDVAYRAIFDAIVR